METPPSDSPRVLGFDTGFFVRLLEGDARAAEVWADVRAGRASGAVSCISLFELDRLGLRHVVPPDAARALASAIPIVCRTVWIDAEHGADLLARAVRVGHGNGLAMADAIILASLLDASADKVYTTDPDLERYDGPLEIVRL